MEELDLVKRVSLAFMQGLKNLLPGYFALVMATGIVSIGAHLLQMEAISQVLFDVNIVFYAILWVLYLFRVGLCARRVWNDLGDPVRGPGFFTMVAGTCVLGSQFVLLRKEAVVAGILWWVGCALWLMLIYIILSRLIVKPDKPPFEKGINGSWLVIVVATQSISVLGSLLAANVTAYKDILLFFTLGMYLLGGILYVPIISLILYRLLFFKLEPEQLTPPYWISMGAAAISTLAGDTLILNASQWDFLTGLLPFLKGLNALFWAAATWWIPLLIVLGVWRHLYRHYPLHYDPQYWSLVFPLGMYTVCSFQQAKALNLVFLYTIPRYFIFVALAAWLIAFTGLIFTLVGSLFQGEA
jgi:tellurite resistance protein TehA-like permease